MKKRVVTAKTTDLFYTVTDTSKFPPRTIREPFSIRRLNKNNAILNINSGLGGAFSLDYKGAKNGVMFFNVINPGYENITYQVAMT